MFHSDSMGEPKIEFPKDPSVTQYAEFLTCLCSTGNTEEHLLVLCCYPLHKKTEVKREVFSEHHVVSHGQRTSQYPLHNDDVVLVSVPETLIPCDPINSQIALR